MALECESMSDERTIRVLAFGSAAAALGWSERDFAATEFPTLLKLAEHLEKQCERLAAARGRVRYARNQQFAPLSSELRGGDEIAIIPPVSGG